MNRTMRRVAAGVVAAVAAGALSMAAAAPAQATPTQCAKHLRAKGYIVGPKVKAACKTGGLGTRPAFDKCVYSLVVIEVGKSDAQYACKLAGVK